MEKKDSGHVISFEGVTKRYSAGTRSIDVVKNVSFRIRQGEFVSIMGPSGSGKSTILQLMGCLDRPTEGKVIIDEQDVAKMNSEMLAGVRSRKIGFVFQAFNLMPNLSAMQNVEISMAINEVPRRERTERAKELLKLVGLTERENHKPNELSGGEKQRVAIARALANEPSFLLADEPTGNLDSKSGEDLLALIRMLWKNGTTIVLVTHDSEIAEMSERIIRIRDGKIESEEVHNWKEKIKSGKKIREKVV